MLVTFLWIFFKYDLSSAFDIIVRMFNFSGIDLELIGLTHNEVLWLGFVVGFVIISDIVRYFFDVSRFIGKRVFVFRYAIYVALILVFLVFGMYGGSFDTNDFIYRWF